MKVVFLLIVLFLGTSTAVRIPQLRSLLKLIAELEQRGEEVHTSTPTGAGRENGDLPVNNSVLTTPVVPEDSYPGNLHSYSSDNEGLIPDYSTIASHLASLRLYLAAERERIVSDLATSLLLLSAHSFRFPERDFECPLLKMHYRFIRRTESIINKELTLDQSRICRFLESATDDIDTAEDVSTICNTTIPHLLPVIHYVITDIITIKTVMPYAELKEVLRTEIVSRLPYLHSNDVSTVVKEIQGHVQRALLDFRCPTWEQYLGRLNKVAMTGKLWLPGSFTYLRRYLYLLHPSIAASKTASSILEAFSDKSFDALKHVERPLSSYFQKPWTFEDLFMFISDTGTIREYGRQCVEVAEVLSRSVIVAPIDVRTNGELPSNLGTVLQNICNSLITFSPEQSDTEKATQRPESNLSMRELKDLAERLG